MYNTTYIHQLQLVLVTLQASITYRDIWLETYGCTLAFLARLFPLCAHTVTSQAVQYKPKYNNFDKLNLLLVTKRNV